MTGQDRPIRLKDSTTASRLTSWALTLHPGTTLTILTTVTPTGRRRGIATPPVHTTEEVGLDPLGPALTSLCGGRSQAPFRETHLLSYRKRTNLKVKVHLATLIVTTQPVHRTGASIDYRYRSPVTMTTAVVWLGTLMPEGLVKR